MPQSLTTRAVKKRLSTAGGSDFLVILAASSDSTLKVGQVIPVKPVSLIGRFDDSGVVLADETVSKDHAMIEHRADGWYLSDHGSTNGTLLSGRVFKGEVLLKKKELLTFGQVETLWWQGAREDIEFQAEIARHGIELL